GGISGRSTGYTGSATKEPGEPNHAGNVGGKSIWWAFEAPNYLFGGYGTKITFSTAGSDFDTLLAVYRGSNVSSLTLVASNDDAHGTSQSEVSFNMDHDLYFIAVDGYKPPTGIAASGNVILSWNVNDAFADSLGLPSWNSGEQDGANGGATAEPNEPAHGGQPARHSTWFHWTAPQTGSVRFGYQGNFTPLMGAYTGTTLAGLQEVAYTERSGATMRFCAAAGTTYRIAVDGANTGSFQIGWTLDVTPRRLAAFIAEGDGRLRVNGVNVDGYYEGDFAACQSVELRALKTSPQWTFKRWAGDIESTNAVIQVPVGKDMEVRAHYEITAYQLVAECHGPGDITVDGVWSGSRYEKWLPIGTTVQARADAAPGFAFLRWNGSVVSTDNPVEVTLDESVRIYAEFLKLETVKVYPDRDATLYADAAGSIANGSGEWLFAGKEYDALRKALVRFDLDGLLPEDAVIQRADFWLYHEPHTSANNMDLKLIKIGQDWGEGASNAAGDESLGAPAQSGDATWLHSRYNKEFWTVPGGSTLGDFSGTISIWTLPSRYGCYSTAPGNAQMLTDVQQWIDQPEQNFGWMIVDDAAPAIKRFGSRQNSNQNLWPRLDITYGTYYPGYTSEPECTKRFSMEGLPVTIPPTSSASVTLDVEESVVIKDLNVEISLDTDYIDGISLYLYSPEGNEAMLVENVRKSGSYFTGTIFNYEAIQSIHAGTDPFTGNHRPDTPLFYMDGENARGEWELYIENVNGYRAVLSEFTLCITPEKEEEPVVPHPADLNEDFKLVLSEAIGYLAGWQQGGNPIGHAIRAAYLWQNGEDYRYKSELSE
ncbi:MAG TPA: DNRLRE domain-containing protein, partial [Candidatus Hydrogenedentes bacterium]|nr:DNRLRE domain-containing protein [Candidatus Hydrogenedentota bacterium]